MTALNIDVLSIHPSVTSEWTLSGPFPPPPNFVPNHFVTRFIMKLIVFVSVFWMISTVVCRPRSCIPGVTVCNCYSNFNIIQCSGLNRMPSLPPYAAMEVRLLTILQHTISYIPSGYVNSLPQIQLIDIRDQVGGFFNCTSVPETPVRIVLPPTCQAVTTLITPDNTTAFNRSTSRPYTGNIVNMTTGKEGPKTRYVRLSYFMEN